VIRNRSHVPWKKPCLTRSRRNRLSPRPRRKPPQLHEADGCTVQSSSKGPDMCHKPESVCFFFTLRFLYTSLYSLFSRKSLSTRGTTWVRSYFLPQRIPVSGTDVAETTPVGDTWRQGQPDTQKRRYASCLELPS